MVNLILVLLSISLTAATLFASMNYLPGWASTASDAHHLTRHGFVGLEKAFQAALARADGEAPAPTVAPDGGLVSNFSADYTYQPKAPKGYAWKYGFNGSDYYFCLHPQQGTVGASEGLWRGMKRARTVLSDQQYFIVQGGVSACDSPSPASVAIASDPEEFPASVSAIYLLRYTPPPYVEPVPDPNPAPAPSEPL